jgi:predicted N-formylglutamate amidohydrolase
MNDTLDRLLAADEPPPFTVDNEAGTSPFLIVADHAGKHFPRRLEQLGVSDAECERHIAWDIGIGAVCRLLGQALDAVVIIIPAWSSTATARRDRRLRSQT